MNNLITRCVNNLGQWHEVALTMTKAIVAIGVLCLVVYLLTIGYIPSEISFGDTLIFLLIFAACSIVYAGLSIVLFFFGISLMPVTYIILNIVNKYLPSHEKIRDDLPFPKISIITFIASIWFIYIIRNLLLTHWQVSLYVGCTVSWIAFLYYAFYVNQKILKFLVRSLKI